MYMNAYNMAAEQTRNLDKFSFMSEKDLVKRLPVNRRLKRPPPLSSAPFSSSPTAPSGRRGGANSKFLRRLSKSSKPLELLKRCKSEPALLRRVRENDGDRDHDQQQRCRTAAAEGRPQTCSTEFFRSSSEYTLLTPSPRKLYEGYNKDAKVVVNVTVQGSPGPIRTMVRLGSSVEEAIRLFTQKYSEEGRTPPLDKDAASTFQLHHSNFSLHCLERRNAIGDAGSRSFFLRKGGDSHWSSSSSSESLNSGYINDNKRAASGSNRYPVAFMLDLIAAKLHKFVRRSSRKLCRFLICI